MLALSAHGDTGGEATSGGIAWLKARQRSDGGWAPRDQVDQSTWVTALPLLLPGGVLAHVDAPKAVDWLMTQSGRESGWVNRLRMLLIGVRDDTDVSNPGWPWYPDTAAWVSPTALTLLALGKIQKRQSSKLLENRCAGGRAYLLARRCADRGWNHGSTRALGYDGPSYPETTGLALLALHGAGGLEASLDMAAKHLAEARSLEAVSWLRMGLAAHSRPAVPPHAAELEPRTLVDLSLALIADAAAERGNIFLE